MVPENAGDKIMHTFKFQRSLSWDGDAAADKQQLLIHQFLFFFEVVEGKQKGRPHCKDGRNVFSTFKMS